MVRYLIICFTVLICMGIAQIDEVQKKAMNASESVVQDREQRSSGVNPENITLPGGHKAWKITIPGNRPLATVAYENGIVFLGGGYGSYEFYALDVETGKPVWMFKTGDDGPTAAVVKNGYVVFNTESCIIYVLKAKTGEKVWEKWLGDPLMSQPAVDEENVYMAYPGNDGSHHLACMKLKTGKEVWDAKIAGDLISAPIIYKNSVYITCFDGTVYRYDKTNGKLIWSQKKNATCAPTIYNDRIFVSLREAQKVGKDSVKQYEGIATLDQNNGNQQQKDLWAKKAAEYLVYGRQSANRKVQAELDASVGFSSVPGTAKMEQAQDNVGQGSVVGCWAYQGSRPFVRERYSYNAMGNEIQSIDIETGKTRWSQKYDKLTEESIGGRVFTPPSYANSKLFVCSGSGEVFCLREDNGKLLWKEKIDGSISFQPAIANGYVFVSCDNGNLYGIRTGDKNDDGWYMWGGNAEHNK
ncbi:MAG: PQQ-binding-like beta-propeller repeat protein [candidate division WOR-3 bacterium]